MMNLLLASTSTIHKSAYLEYLLPEVDRLFNGIDEVLFIPFARPSGISYEEYTSIAAEAFRHISISIKGIHEYKNEELALKNAKGIFIGGGNTFVLVKELYDKNLMSVLKDSIEMGTPYLGTSAGSNICGVTMQTTNDMPIVMPSSFQGLSSIPFNLNVHYLDPDPNSKHKGETREIRIREFHVYNDVTVLGLREGSWLSVNNNEIILKGNLTARLFEKDKPPKELEPSIDLGKLIK